MTSIHEAVKKGPVMTMTQKCETEFPKAFKNLMLSMGMQGEAVYKGFPVIDEGQEYWWVQLHLYKDKEDDHKMMGLWMFTNSKMYTSFLDSARCAAWSAIKELGERLKWTLHNTQKDLKEEKEDATTLKETISQLQNDLEQLVSELSVQRDLIKTKDDQISDLKKQLDQNNGST
jgi:TRAP-type C4-dicarboxylate transport system substrate-binding protein